jgi:hypothetical protein
MTDPHVRRGPQHTNDPNLWGPETIGIRGLTRRKRYAPVVGAYAHTFRMRHETREVLTVVDNAMCEPLHCPLASANDNCMSLDRPSAGAVDCRAGAR